MTKYFKYFAKHNQSKRGFEPLKAKTRADGAAVATSGVLPSRTDYLSRRPAKACHKRKCQDQPVLQGE
eukprot:scaffold126233_cov17-Prasinocladus_malaysianus.AAC.1